MFAITHKSLPCALVLLLLSACAAPVPHTTLTVFAAASLTESFTELGRQFEAQHPGAAVSFNFAGSQQLVQQLAQGAPADVLAAANMREMERAVDAGLVLSGTPRIFAHNALVVIVPRDNRAGIRGLQDLARPGVKIDMADPSVPAGAYAREALDRIGAGGQFGTDFAQRVDANVVSREENVRAVVAKVALGEADAGIVYRTDARAQASLQVLEIPDAFNVVAAYPLAALARAPAGAAQARAFVDFVLSPAGAAVLAKYGFSPP